MKITKKKYLGCGILNASQEKSDRTEPTTHTYMLNSFTKQKESLDGRILLNFFHENYTIRYIEEK